MSGARLRQGFGGHVSRRPKTSDSCGSDGNSPFSFLFHPVRRRVTVVHFADFVRHAGIKKYPLGRRRFARVNVRAILASQFADVPAIANPNEVTKREEDRIVGYYAGGTLYATPSRMGPVL